MRLDRSAKHRAGSSEDNKISKVKEKKRLISLRDGALEGQRGYICHRNDGMFINIQSQKAGEERKDAIRKKGNIDSPHRVKMSVLAKFFLLNCCSVSKFLC